MAQGEQAYKHYVAELAREADTGRKNQFENALLSLEFPERWQLKESFNQGKPMFVLQAPELRFPRYVHSWYGGYIAYERRVPFTIEVYSYTLDNYTSRFGWNEFQKAAFMTAFQELGLEAIPQFVPVQSFFPGGETAHTTTTLNGAQALMVVGWHDWHPLGLWGGRLFIANGNILIEVRVTEDSGVPVDRVIASEKQAFQLIHERPYFEIIDSLTLVAPPEPS